MTDQDWDTLATYELLSRHLKPEMWKEDPDAQSGGNPLIAQAQKFGGG